MFRINKLLISGSQLSAKYVSQQKLQNALTAPIRTLYSLNSMGVDTYIEIREKVKSNLVDNNGERFKSKMNEFLENPKGSIIFTEDLKNMVHVVEKTAEDVELVVKMLKKFNSQNKEVRFGNFIFGPVVMRMFHYLKDVDLALQMFRDPEMKGFFDQLISYQILVDMLYEEGRYQDVIDVFTDIKSRQIQGGMYPKHVIVLVFAACYKENTPESFKYSTDLWKELTEVGHIPMRKAVTFASALALEQNAPHIALEMVGTVRQQHYMTVRNLKLLALTQLGRADDTIPILRSVLEVSDPNENKHTFAKDVIDTVRETINKSGNEENIQNFKRIEKFLSDNGQITETTLKELLCAQIQSTPQQQIRRERSVLAASYSNERNRQYSNYNDNNNNYNNYNRNNNSRPTNNNFQSRRPGLRELY